MQYLGKNTSNYGIFKEHPYYLQVAEKRSSPSGMFTELDRKLKKIYVFKTEKQLLSFYNRFKRAKGKHNVHELPF